MLMAHKHTKAHAPLRWRRVMVQGPGPSARYAHTLALVANRFLVAMGGNDGKQTLSDAWALDTSDKPYQWRKITDAGETPSPRSVQHHTGCTCPAPQFALVTGQRYTLHTCLEEGEASLKFLARATSV